MKHPPSGRAEFCVRDGNSLQQWRVRRSSAPRGFAVSDRRSACHAGPFQAVPEAVIAEWRRPRGGTPGRCGRLPALSRRYSTSSLPQKPKRLRASRNTFLKVDAVSAPLPTTAKLSRCSCRNEALTGPAGCPVASPVFQSVSRPVRADRRALIAAAHLLAFADCVELAVHRPPMVPFLTTTFWSRKPSQGSPMRARLCNGTRSVTKWRSSSGWKSSRPNSIGPLFLGGRAAGARPRSSSRSARRGPGALRRIQAEAVLRARSPSDPVQGHAVQTHDKLPTVQWRRRRRTSTRFRPSECAGLHVEAVRRAVVEHQP